MSKTVQMVLVLAVIGLACGGSLGAMHLWTRVRIEANIKAEFEDKVGNLFPEASIEERQLPDETKLYTAKGADGQVVGYAFVAEGMGYQDVITLVVGVTPDLTKMVGLEVMSTKETPGLGKRIEEPEFRGQFADDPKRDISGPLKLVKGEASAADEVSAVTGATVSSTAVVDILNKRIAEIRELVAGAP